MKMKSILILVLPLVFVLFSCEKKAIYKTFDIEYSFKTVVPANALISSPLFPISFEEESNSENQYSLNDTRKDLVEDVFVQSFLLEVVSPQGEDLSWLNAATFYINADAEPETVVAYKDPVPANAGAELLLDIEPVNLAPYIRKDPFEIRTKVVTDENRTQDVTLQGLVKFQVKARVIGLD